MARRPPEQPPRTGASCRAWLRSASPLWAQLRGPNGPPCCPPEQVSRSHLHPTRNILVFFYRKGKGKRKQNKVFFKSRRGETKGPRPPGMCLESGDKDGHGKMSMAFQESLRPAPWEFRPGFQQALWEGLACDAAAHVSMGKGVGHGCPRHPTRG